MTYPATFFVAHKLFSGPPFAVPVWGEIMDGPQDFRGMIDRVNDAFADDDCTVDVLRVFRLENGRYTDMTLSVVASVNETKTRVSDRFATSA